MLHEIERAIKDIAAGKAVIVVDDEDRENEGDLIFAAEHATPELVAFMRRWTSGYICAPITEEEADRLDLPPQYHSNQDRRGTAYTVTVDARGLLVDLGIDQRAMRRLRADQLSEQITTLVRDADRQLTDRRNQILNAAVQPVPDYADVRLCGDGPAGASDD